MFLENRHAETPGVLSPREYEVMSLYAEGLTHKQIAEKLGISPSTVNTYASSGRRRLGVRTPAQTVLKMQELGWHAKAALPPPEPEPDEPLTGVWRAYLRAFDRHLTTHHDESAHDQARIEMRWLYGAGHIDDRLPIPPRRYNRRDGTECLIAITTAH